MRTPMRRALGALRPRKARNCRARENELTQSLRAMEAGIKGFEDQLSLLIAVVASEHGIATGLPARGSARS
jgi:hypothetical protein